jgi:hypothetical protein
MTIKYGLQFFFYELTDNDGQNFLAGIVPTIGCSFKFPGKVGVEGSIVNASAV